MHMFRSDPTPDLLRIKNMLIENPAFKVIPWWYTGINEIEDTYLYKPIPERSAIICDVDVELLVSKLVCGRQTILDKSRLFEKYGFKDERTCRIIRHWQEGKRLTPPTIFTEAGSQMLKMDDGMHRLDTARYFGATKIPIVVDIDSVDKIQKILTCVYK